MLIGVAVWAFFWAVGHGQFEELDGPARSALEEDALSEDAKPPPR
jgi:cbb3-type cytochrome oxidase maturation protein